MLRFNSFLSALFFFFFQSKIDDDIQCIGFDIEIDYFALEKKGMSRRREQRRKKREKEAESYMKEKIQNRVLIRTAVVCFI